MEIEFIIPTYNRPNGLLTIIGSILQQTNTNWRIHVVADGIYDGYERIKDFFKDNEKIKFSELNGPHHDWGHTAREYGLQNSTTEWVVMTGDDNYYVPAFVQHFYKSVELNKEANFVYCDMLHDHETHTASYNYFVSYIRNGYIDIGNFATKTELSKHITLKKDNYAADFEFVKEYVDKYCNDNTIMKINKALYIHN